MLALTDGPIGAVLDVAVLGLYVAGAARYAIFQVPKMRASLNGGLARRDVFVLYLRLAVRTTTWFVVPFAMWVPLAGAFSRELQGLGVVALGAFLLQAGLIYLLTELAYAFVGFVNADYGRPSGIQRNH